ncbi:MAG: hypothetical protein ACE5PV_09505 [Candidatus Poribacteria bacterium]
MTKRRVYDKLHYNGEDYVDATFVGNEFRYAWLPTTRHMKDLIAMQARRRMRVIDGRRRFERRL